MTGKIFKGIFLSCLVSMLACLVLIIGVLYDHYDSQLNDDLKSETELIASGMNNYGDDYLKGLDGISERITLIDKSGTVLYDTAAETADAQNHSDREEIIEAYETGVGESVRDSGTLGQKTVYYAVLLDNNMVLRLSMSKSSVWRLLIETMPSIIFIIVAIVILSLFLSSMLAKRIVEPINQIDPDNPDKEFVYDELTPLIRKIGRQNKRIKREKEKLSRSHEELKLITGNMSEGLLIIDDKADILSCNAAATRLLSSNDTDVVGKSVFVLNRSKEFAKAAMAALKGQNSEHILKVGEKVYQLIASPVYTEQAVSGAVMIILDVTEREERETLRREFTSNVSHELKTPLTSIYGISDMLASGMVKPEDVGGFAGDINREAGRLIELVEDIIRLSRLDEGGFSDEKSPVDLYDIAQSVTESLASAAKKADVRFITEAEHCMVMGHPTILNEIVFNLCDNAIKYNKKGGFVKLSVKAEEQSSVITVEDSGIGIPAADLDRVFERFYRVDKSHSGTVSGTGLGLSIVKHGVAYHSGKTELQSTEGKGTTVRVIL